MRKFTNLDFNVDISKEETPVQSGDSYMQKEGSGERKRKTYEFKAWFPISKLVLRKHSLKKKMMQIK